MEDIKLMMKAKIKGKGVRFVLYMGLIIKTIKKKLNSIKLVFTSKHCYMFLPLEVKTKTGLYTSKEKASRLG